MSTTRHGSKRRKSVLIACLLLLSIGAAALILDRHWRRHGLPLRFRNQIRDRLTAAGINVDFTAVRAGLGTRIILDAVALRDPGLGGWPVLQAPQVELQVDGASLLRGRAEIQTLRFERGRLKLPLSTAAGDSDDVVDVTDLAVELTFLPSHVAFEASGRFEGIPVTAKGYVGRSKWADTMAGEGTPKPRDTEVRRRPRSVTLRPYLERINAVTIDIVHRVQRFCRAARAGRSANLALTVEWPNLPYSENRVAARFGLRAVLFNGLAIERLDADVTVNGDLVVDGSLHAFLDNDETLQTDLDLDLKRKRVAGTLTYSGFPRKLLRAAVPTLLNDVTLPEFSGAPPELQVTLRPSPLDHPEQWAAEVTLKARATQLWALEVSDFEATGRLRDGILSIQAMRARVQPNIDLEAAGQWDLGAGDVCLHVIADGSPMFVESLIRHPRAARNYRRLFQRFNWRSTARPHVELDLVSASKGSDPALVLDGRFTAYSVAYQDVGVERATGRFFLDIPAALYLIYDLDIRSHGRQGTGRLAFQYGEADRLDFNVDSSLPADALLGLINRKWPAGVADRGFALPEAPHARAAGRVDLKAPWDVTCDGYLEAPALHYRDLALRDVAGAFRYQSSSKSLQAKALRAMMLTCKGWVVEGVEGSSLIIDQDGLRLEATAQAGRGHGWETATTKASVTASKGNVVVSSRSSELHRGPWHLVDVTQGLSWDGKALSGECTAAASTYGDWQMAGLEGAWKWQDKGWSFDARATTASLTDQLQAHTLSITGRAAVGGPVAGAATAAALTHARTGATGKNAAFDYQWTGSGLDVNCRIPHLATRQQLGLDSVELTLNVRPDAPIGGTIKASDANWQGRVRGRDLSATFTSRDGFLYCNGVAAELSGADWQARKAQMDGRYDAELLRLHLHGAELDYRGLPFTAVDGRALIEGRRLSLDDLHATLFDGTLGGNLVYDLEKRRGQLRLLTRGVGFGGLVRAFADPRKGTISGRLNSVFDLAFERPETALQLRGFGRIQIQESYLWSVPLLFDFMSMLDRVIPASDLAKITEMETTLEFLGDRVHATRLRTNGTLVAVTGAGQYWWDSGKLDFRLRAEPLKNLFLWKYLPEIPVLSELMKQPLEVLLERRLVGTVSKPKWEDITVIKDIFRHRKELP